MVCNDALDVCNIIDRTQNQIHKVSDDMNLHKEGRLRQKLLYCAFVILALGLFIGYLTPYVTWVGPKFLTLRFQILEADLGEPVENARVVLIHSYDPEQPPIEGVTDRDGVVRLRARFTESGGSHRRDQQPASGFVSYGGWAVRVTSKGHDDLCAFLGDVRFSMSKFGANEACTRLNLQYPPPEVIVLKISRRGRCGQWGDGRGLGKVGVRGKARKACHNGFGAGT